MKKLGIGIIGDNKIAKILATQLQQMEKKGAAVQLVSLASEKPEHEFTGMKVTPNVDLLVESDTVDVVVVCLESVMKSFDYARKALELGKHVVTNNSTMLAAQGEKLWRLAEDKNVHLRFEACAMGAVPIFDSLFNHFKQQSFNRIYGTLSASCNYALMRMKDKGDKLVDALSDAEELGYAEKDPNVDLSGKDSLFKLSLMHTAAFGQWVDVGHKKVEGLEGLEPIDIQLCQKMAANIKLLAFSNGEEISVSPTLFEEYSQIGNTTGTLSGIVIETAESGPVFFCGHAADKESIASALCADCVKISNGYKPWKLAKHQNKELLNIKNKQYYLRLTEEDSEHVLKANNLHIIEECSLQTTQGLFKAYIVETGMPKLELISFLKHTGFQHAYYLMNVFKD